MASSGVNQKKVTSEVLHSPEHLRTLFQRLRSDETLHDVTFIVQNERFSVNRCVVADASPVFRQMLTNGMKETKASEIPLEEVNLNGWIMVLDYEYTAEVKIDDIDAALECLECANRFQVQGLELIVSDYIEKKLDTDNCYRILVIADRTNLTSLRNLVMKTISKNFYQLRFSHRSTYLPFDLILEVLKSDNLAVRSELDVFMAVLRWCVCSGVEDIQPEVNSQIATRACELFAQFKFISNNFVMIEPESSNIGTYPELFDCVNINDLVINDLRLVVRVCRQLCAEAQAQWEIDLVHVRQFGEKALDRLLELSDPIPSPYSRILPYKRMPIARNTKIFSFSYTFCDVQRLISSATEVRKSPKFLDEPRQVKWSLHVYFRGYSSEDLDNYVSVFLHRDSGGVSNAGGEEDMEFGFELVAEVEDDCALDTAFFSYINMKYKTSQRRGSRKLVPISSLRGKFTLLIGATIYAKPE